MPSPATAATEVAPAADDDRSPLADEDGTEDDLDSDGSGSGGEDEPLCSPTTEPAPEGAALRIVPISSAMPSDFPTPSSGGRAPVVHRLWTDEDEMAFLQGFQEYTSRRGTTGRRAPRHGVRPFFEEIRERLQLGFNKSQLVEKLRRLKKKYRLTVARMASGKGFAFRSPHDSKAFEISSLIWSHAASGTAEDAELLLRRARRRRRKAATAAAALAAPELAPPAAPEPAPDNDTVMPTADAATVSEAAEVPVTEAEVPAEPVEVEVKATVQSVANGVPPIVMALAAHGTTPPPFRNPIAAEAVRSSATPPFKEATPQHAGVDGPSTPPVTRSSGGAAGEPHLDTGIPLPPGFTDGFEKAAAAAAAAASAAAAAAMEGKWRDQMVLELEVYSKRLELAQEQIKLTIQELRRPPSGV